MMIKPEDYVNELVKMSEQLQRAEVEVQETRQSMFKQSKVHTQTIVLYNNLRRKDIKQLKKEHKKEIEQLKELLEFRRFISKISIRCQTKKN